MHLKKWLSQNELTYQQFADKIGIHRQTIVNLMAGRDVMLSVACKIEDATLGVVKCRDLCGYYYNHKLDQSDDKPNNESHKQQQQNDAGTNAPV